MNFKKIRAIDSHTGGEPTRIIIDGGPPLQSLSVRAQLQEFRTSYDTIRRATVIEPRGSEVLVGALLCKPEQNSTTTGVIFFNNVGYLGMCGHGTIGLMVTLRYLKQIHLGMHTLETPVGLVQAELHDAHHVTVRNVPSYRYRKQIQVKVPDLGSVVGDIAWGGNWFFLTDYTKSPIDSGHQEQLLDYARKTKEALKAQGITGNEGAEIDHIELFSPPHDTKNHSRNYVLCPGGVYDRSPCGTGTSAKLACLLADGKIQENELWRQESILGSVFEGSIAREGTALIPKIRGSAFISADNTLLIDPEDPWKWGIPK